MGREIDMEDKIKALNKISELADGLANKIEQEQSYINVLGDEEMKNILSDCLNIFFTAGDRWMKDERGIKYIREDVVLKAMQIVANGYNKKKVK